jgi:hypothetical protein
MSHVDPSLQTVLDRMAARQRVDWAQAETSADSAQQRVWLDQLARLDTMARFYSDRPLEPARGAAGTETAELDATQAPLSTGQSASGPQSWGPLSLLEPMGSGAFGEVHRAWDKRLNRQVALKLLRSDREASAESMLEEARRLARVEHAHVVRIHGAEEHEGRPGIWMEFVEGTTLARLAEERGKLQPREVCELGVALCEALAAVHAAGVVHQDIKLQNLMQRRSGELVLMDFGAGRRRSAPLATERSLSGTPRYIAPELLQGATASPQSDLWSVGVVLFRLVSGVFPVDGQSVEEIFDALRAGRRRSLADAAPNVAPRLAAAIERALDFDPSRRFASATEMAAALRAAATRRSPRALWLAAAALGVLLLALVGRFVWTAAPLQVQTQWTAIGAFERPLVAGDAISPDEQLRLRLSLNRDAHVYVLNRDESGSTTLLHPARDAGDAEMAGGREHWIPTAPDGKQLAWTLSATAGLESFLVVASEQPLRDFERELARLAAVDLGSGVVVRPMPQLALNSLTRGVTGVREVAPTPGSAPAADVFDLARQMAASAPSEAGVQLSMFVLENTGAQ